MRLSRKNLCCAAVLCSFFLLTSCSSHQKTTKHPSLGASNSGIASSEAPCALPSGDVEDVEESTLAEPEQSAKEEIAALDRLGDWKAGAKTMSGAALATGYELSGYDFPVVLNKQVNYYLELFQGKQRNDFARWLARSSRYVPAIEKELIKAGLPRDLAFLAMIESGYNPSAVSCAGAGGLWQFMPATGRQYNLTINSWVDERREPEKATQAAIRYLSRLYRQFNDWHLAVAAYNTGEGKIEQAIKAENTSDFWELAASEGIYLETKRYVPKLIAAIIIARNPAAYGFDNIEFQPAHRYEVVHVPGSTDLAAVASTANTSVKHLRTLNNELLKNHTPPLDKKYALRVPLGCKDLVAANIDKLRLQPAKSTKAYATHVVKKGETLTAISKRYQISMTDLLKSNKLRASQLKAGQRLQIPVAADRVLIAKATKQPDTLIANKQAQINQTYRIQKGDTLDKIARKHGVSVAQIKKWNAIKDNRSLLVGQSLSLRAAAKDSPAKPSGSSQVAALTASAKTSVQQANAATPVTQQGTKVIALATKVSGKSDAVRTLAQPKAASKQPAKKAADTPKSWYVVQNGDSMWTIAKKFSVSVADIREWNKLSSNKLQVGNRLVVKRG